MTSNGEPFPPFPEEPDPDDEFIWGCLTCAWLAEPEDFKDGKVPVICPLCDARGHNGIRGMPRGAWADHETDLSWPSLAYGSDD